MTPQIHNGKEVSLQKHNAEIVKHVHQHEMEMSYSQQKIAEVSRRLAFLFSSKCQHLAGKYKYDPRMNSILVDGVSRVTPGDKIFQDIEKLAAVEFSRERLDGSKRQIESVLEIADQSFAIRENINKLKKEPIISEYEFNQIFNIDERVGYTDTSFLRRDTELVSVVYARFLTKCHKEVIERQQELINQFPHENPQVLIAKNMKMFAWLSEPLISRHLDLYLVEELLRLKPMQL